MKAIALSRGLHTIVDDADFDELSRFSWHAIIVGRQKKAPYARATVAPHERAMLHRFLIPAGPGLVVDHINGDTLDNRRCNLRVCTEQQNRQNSAKYLTARGGAPSSPYKGVHLVKGGPRARKIRWISFIYRDGKKTYLGRYVTAEKAARAYDTAAKQFFGPFARVNFPEQVTPSLHVDIHADGRTKSWPSEPEIRLSGTG